MKKIGIIFILVAVVGVIGTTYILLKPKKQPAATTPTGNINSIDLATPDTFSSSESGTTPSTDTTPPVAENVITYTDSGFSPHSLSVKAGSQIIVKNNSSRGLQFASDPHPQHTDDPELNFGIIGRNSSMTATITKLGSHGYHNHLNDDDTGTIIVE